MHSGCGLSSLDDGPHNLWPSVVIDTVGRNLATAGAFALVDVAFEPQQSPAPAPLFSRLSPERLPLSGKVTSVVSVACCRLLSLTPLDPPQDGELLRSDRRSRRRSTLIGPRRFHSKPQRLQHSQFHLAELGLITSNGMTKSAHRSPAYLAEMVRERVARNEQGKYETNN